MQTERPQLAEHAFSDTIYIAAADSAGEDKAGAHFVCDGTHDEVTLQAAVEQIAAPVAGEIRGRHIVLLPGHYYIDAFPRKTPTGWAAVQIPDATNAFSHIGLWITGSVHTEATCIHVTKECYDSLPTPAEGGSNCGDSYSIFAGASHNWNHHVFEDLYVTVPDSQKNIVCFDGRLLGAMGLRRCKCLCDTRGNYGKTVEPLPVEGFVAFMGTYGSNNMWEEKWEFCQAEGFGQGFAVGSEHLLLHKCAALFGRYGYTFNNYPCPFGAVVHPVTLLNCLDEANANLWKLGKNDFRQCIMAYNTSFERVPAWLRLDGGGRYAHEERPGDYCGHIDYVANGGYYTANDPTIRFWEEGSGVHMETVNNAQKKLCTSAERRTYATHVGQEIFDTDLGKKLIWLGDRWVDSMGQPVTETEKEQ